MNTERFRNPFQFCYPQFFESVDFHDIHCYGITSISTLSDDRFEFEEKKRWLELRRSLLLKEREQTTETLLKAGKRPDEIERAYEIILKYHDVLISATKEELSHVHEQEIYHRVIAIGRK